MSNKSKNSPSADNSKMMMVAPKNSNSVEKKMPMQTKSKVKIPKLQMDQSHEESKGGPSNKHRKPQE